MKIAHLISTFLPSVGGAEVCVHNLATEQVKKGHTVKVIAPKRGSNLYLNYEILPLKPRSVFLSMLPGIGSVYFVDQLRRYQKRYQFDIWQVTIGYPFGTAAVDFFNKEGIPCVLRCSGEDIQTDPGIGYGARLRRWPNYLIKKNYPRFDGVISIVESITRDCLEIGIPEERIYYIPNGINKAHFDIKVDRERIKKILGIDPRKRLIVTVGRNHPKKGFGQIPDIIYNLSKRRDDFIWLLIGKGNSKIERIARRMGVGRFFMAKEGVEDGGFLSFPPRGLVEIYKSADVFSLPTLIEGCSNVIVEAMASSLPVVSTDVTGIKDKIAHGKTGLLSRKNDPDDMAGNIERLLNDSLLCEEIRNNALTTIKDLDWPDIADRYIDVYDNVTRRKKG